MTAIFLVAQLLLVAQSNEPRRIPLFANGDSWEWSETTDDGNRSWTHPVVVRIEGAKRDGQKNRFKRLTRSVDPGAYGYDPGSHRGPLQDILEEVCEQDLKTRDVFVTFAKPLNGASYVSRRVPYLLIKGIFPTSAQPKDAVSRKAGYFGDLFGSMEWRGAQEVAGPNGEDLWCLSFRKSDSLSGASQSALFCPDLGCFVSQNLSLPTMKKSMNLVAESVSTRRIRNGS